MMGPWLLFASFLNRSSLVFFDGAPHHETFLDWIVESRATHLGVVPSLVKAWIHQQSLQKLRESSLEVLSSTGECSNRKDMFILSHACGFRPVIEYCGGTEIGGAYISNHRTHSIAPSTFSGATLGLDFVILDSQQQESDQGEVFLVPPSVGLSEKLLGRDHDAIYYKKAPVHAKGPLRVHGDEMLRVRDGLFRALGRMDDTMNLSGIKVSAVEIERVLHGIPGLQDVAAVARSPEGGGPSQLVLYAVLENPDHKERIEKQAQDRIRTQLNPLFKISKLQGVDSLPRTASNKLMRRLLK
jgi:acetyl-CoA synthetase